jgi:hypothetical protein
VHYIVWLAILAFRFLLFLGFSLAPQCGLFLLIHFLWNLPCHSLINMAYNLLSGFSSEIDFSRTDADPVALLDHWAQYDIGLISADCSVRACRVRLCSSMFKLSSAGLAHMIWRMLHSLGTNWTAAISVGNVLCLPAEIGLIRLWPSLFKCPSPPLCHSSCLRALHLQVASRPWPST